MDLSFSKNYGVNSIILNGESKKVVLAPVPKDFGEVYKTADFVVVTKLSQENAALENKQLFSMKTDQSGFVVATPGEYEKDDIFVSARHNHKDGDVSSDSQPMSSATFSPSSAFGLDVVEVEVEGVNILYYASSEIINKTILSELADIHILIIDLADDITNQLKVINKVDPQVVIPFSDNKSLVEEFKKESGVNYTESKKYKFKLSNFVNEEYVLTGMDLS